MESTFEKLEFAFDFLCDKLFRKEKGVYVSGDLYNMCFEKEFDEEDIEDFLKFCRANDVIDPSDLFDTWYGNIRSKRISEKSE